MHYLWKTVQEVLHNIVTIHSPHIPIVNNIAMDWDFQGAMLDSDIEKHDIVLMISMNGMQLYEGKEFDSWMYIWIIGSLSSNICYCKLNVLPGGFIPGLKKPKNVNFFLFPGMHHLAAIQHKELAI